MNTHALPCHVPITVTDRSGHPDNIHHGSLAVVDAKGRLLTRVGCADSPLFTRSSLKPFQAVPRIARAAERCELSDADVALLCASHSGESMHAERSAALLAKIGEAESDLACGSHVPYFFAANGVTPEPGERFNRLHHNCSGKHTGMLLLAHAWFMARHRCASPAP